MGRSWAFWIAQRIHSHQVLLDTQLAPSQVMGDHAPPPKLADGSAVVLPYCDYLTVLATLLNSGPWASWRTRRSAMSTAS